MTNKKELTKEETKFRENGIKHLKKELNKQGVNGNKIYNTSPAVMEAVFLAGFDYAFVVLEKAKVIKSKKKI